MGLDNREQAVLGLLLDLQLNPASMPTFSSTVPGSDLKSNGNRDFFGVHAMALQKLSAKT